MTEPVGLHLDYPPELPISRAREDILDALRAHRVVVVAGETGSGKTTQLPKMLLELGCGSGTPPRGRRRAPRIGHTQPRRIAARAVAERLAEELQVELGAEVGYQVRFADHSGPQTRIKVMTDGVLLAELSHDPQLRAYDAIVIDEAHERSLNVDFLIGYLTRLVAQREDLRVVITSATIDPGRFADHFAAALGAPVPVIEVSGRTYPVEVRYRPYGAEVDDRGAIRDQPQAIVDAVDELCREGLGDILVFCSGEREIRDGAEALRQHTVPGPGPVEILPLFARLTAAEQHRVFAAHQGRRIVLATNVAETSLTVPGIRYVVDTGLARVSRYSLRTKVQRLPIEPVSQASATQRSGRCGRLGEGICIRLYDEEDFAARPAFTEPEILRTNLASVLLRMADLGLGDIADYPFIDPPDPRQVQSARLLLEELGAVTAGRRGRGHLRLTPIGRKLARLPIDPRLGRMVLAAADAGCLREVLVIAAGMSIQDPRERPADQSAAARTAHSRFDVAGSDFLGYLALWKHLKQAQRERSGSAFRRMCRDEYLHYLRVREWQDLHQQLRSAASDMDLVPNSADATPDTIHQALLTGLLSQVGMYDDRTRDYRGARGTRFQVSPGSVLHPNARPAAPAADDAPLGRGKTAQVRTGGARPDWVMAGDLVETTRLWAHSAAAIDPDWLERAGAHLVTRTYSEPHWSLSRASAVAIEKVSLYGLPIVADRVVPLGPRDPALAREMFVRHALVEGEWKNRHAFTKRNDAARERVQAMEDRARRRDMLADEGDQVEFFLARIPESVVSGAHFDSWWRRAQADDPHLLDLTDAVLLRPESTPADPAEFPSRWNSGPLTFRIDYRFEPGAADDGATITVPEDDLLGMSPVEVSWGVPGMRRELVVALLRTLPKSLRRALGPAPNAADVVLRGDGVGSGLDLPTFAAQALTAATGVRVMPTDFDPGTVPDHLRPTIRVVRGSGRARETVARGKDLPALQREVQRARAEAEAERIRGAAKAAAGAATPAVLLGQRRDPLERDGLTDFPSEGLPAVVERSAGGRSWTGYPALVDRGDRVAIVVFGSAAAQRRAMRAGVRRLVLLGIVSPIRPVMAGLSPVERLGLGGAPDGPAVTMQHCQDVAVDALIARVGWEPTPAGFERLREQVRTNLFAALRATVQAAAAAVGADGQLEVPGVRAGAGAAGWQGYNPVDEVASDVAEQRARLVRPGFVLATGMPQLVELPRYLRAIAVRLEQAPRDPERDAERAAAVRSVEREVFEWIAAAPPGRAEDADVRAVRWMLEELRVSQFAQHLGVRGPVSPQRIRKALAGLPWEA